MTLPTTPHSSATAKLICPLAAQYPAGGITSSLGTGRIDDSIAISATMPGYPRSSSVCSSQAMKRSSIEAVLADEGDKAGVANGRHAGSHGGEVHEGEDLLPLGAEGDDHAAVGRELLDQGRRELGPPGRHQNRMVRRVRTPPQGAVADQDRDVGGARREQRGLIA